MRKFVFASCLIAVAAFTAQTTIAGPKCCGSKTNTDKQKVMSTSLVSGGGSCSKTCDKGSFPRIKYLVGSDAYESQADAWKALAIASEDYVQKFTTIACVVDGQVKYCDQACKDKEAKSACSGNAETVKLVSAEEGKSSCCKSKMAKLASADTKSEGCTEKAKLAKADGEAKTCPITGQVITVDAKGNSSCCKKPCDGNAEKVAATDEAKSSCSKSAETTKLVSSEEKLSCCKSKLAKAEEGDKPACCKDKVAKAKLASAEGTACAEKAKLANAEGCCKSKAADAKLASEKDGCCKDAKNVMYRLAGQDYKTYEEAIAARDKIVKAVETVKMAYVVDGQKVDCASKVCPKAKEAGKVKFVVGEVETQCEFHARVEFAKAQIEAAKLATNDKLATAK